MSRTRALVIAMLVVLGSVVAGIGAIPVFAQESERSLVTAEFGAIEDGTVCVERLAADTNEVVIRNSSYDDVTIHLDENRRVELEQTQPNATIVLHTDRRSDGLDRLAEFGECLSGEQTDVVVTADGVSTSGLTASEYHVDVGPGSEVPGVSGFDVNETDGDENSSAGSGNATDDVTEAIGEGSNDSADQVGETVDETGNQTEDTVDHVEDTVNDTTNRTGEDPVNDTTNNTEETVNDTVNHTEDTVEDTVDHTEGIVDSTLDHVEETVTDITETIVENPSETDEQLVESTEDTIDHTTETVEDTVDHTDETTNETVDGVESTTDNATGPITGTLDTVTWILDTITGDVNEDDETGVLDP